MDFKIDENMLKELGLTESEIVVYLLLIKKGRMKVSQIANETKLNRPNLYKILDKLIDKKLIFSSVSNKVRHFSSTRPERLKDLYNQKLDCLKEKESKLNQFIDDIHKFDEKIIPRELFAVEVYEGVNEIKNLVNSILALDRGEVVRAIGKEGLLAEHPSIKFWFEHFIKKRDKKGIKFYAIYDSDNPQYPKSKNTLIKHTPLKNMKNTEISFYRDVLLIYVVSDKTLKVILIKNPDLVNSMIGYFNLLWEKI